MKKFTDKEIETAKKLLKEYKNQKIVTGFTNYLNSLLKPKRKKIVVEIEYESLNEMLDVDVRYIENIFKVVASDKRKLTVKEYDEGNFIDFGQYVLDHPEYLVANAYKKWLSERNNYLNKK